MDIRDSWVSENLKGMVTACMHKSICRKETNSKVCPNKHHYEVGGGGGIKAQGNKNTVQLHKNDIDIQQKER